MLTILNLLKNHRCLAITLAMALSCAVAAFYAYYEGIASERLSQELVAKDKTIESQAEVINALQSVIDTERATATEVTARATRLENKVTDLTHRINIVKRKLSDEQVLINSTNRIESNFMLTIKRAEGGSMPTDAGATSELIRILAGVTPVGVLQYTIDLRQAAEQCQDKYTALQDIYNIQRNRINKY